MKVDGSGVVAWRLMMLYFFHDSAVYALEPLVHGGDEF